MKSSLADVWARPEDQSLLELGVKRAAGTITLGDVLPKPMVRYQEDPLGFFTEVLEVPERTLRWGTNPGYENHEWDGTVEPIAEMLERLALGWQDGHKDVAVEAGTSTQKSFTLAGIYLWFLASWEDSRVFTFAPKADQLRLYSWMELKKWFWQKFKRHFPLAKETDLRIRMIPGSDQWGAWGYPVQVKAGEEIAQHAKGQHARDLLLVYEECQAIVWPVLEAGRHTATAPHNLRLGVGNPSHQQDSLHRLAELKRSSHIIISAYDHPNVVCDDPHIVPGAVSVGSIEDRREELGEDDPMFKAQVRGISPAQATNAFIQKIWCDHAILLAKDPAKRVELRNDGGFAGLGVDVANVKGRDAAAIAKGIGALCLEVEKIKVGDDPRVSDAAQLGTLVGVYMGLMQVDPLHVGVDPVGVGSSTVNKLRELRFYVQELAGSAAVHTDEDLLREAGRSYVMAGVFGNLRSQMWWQGRVDLQQGKVGLPDDPELVRDLVAVKWELRRGKLYAQEKEEVIIDIGRSPDRGDAWIYWNWVRPRRGRTPQEEKQIGAFDPEVLEHEWREGRKVKTAASPIPAHVHPTITERVE